ncbi:MAG TPA: hypothetical protein VEA80_01010 [Vitreimonas sp.]|nr:hypothetical protein [Vitreimonas sp.]
MGIGGAVQQTLAHDRMFDPNVAGEGAGGGKCFVERPREFLGIVRVNELEPAFGRISR